MTALTHFQQPPFSYALSLTLTHTRKRTHKHTHKHAGNGACGLLQMMSLTF